MHAQPGFVLSESYTDSPTSVKCLTWGHTEEVAFDTMTVDGKRVPAIQFGAFGYFTGAAVSLPDLAKYIAQHHPELLQEALASQTA